MALSQKIKDLIREEAAILWPEINIPPFDITEPPNPEFGDLSTPLPLTLSKMLGQKPMDIADKIKDKISKKTIEHVKEITVTSPGYINFNIDFAKLSKHLFHKVLTQKESFGTSKETKGRVIIEHTSVNPNKAAHVGHLRNACLGDSLSRIMASNGWTIEIQNYIDNTGAQVADILVAMETLPDRQGRKKFDYFCWDIYTKIQHFYETDENLKNRREEILHLLEEGNNEIANKALEITNKIVDCHLQTLSPFGIYYNLLVWESDIIKANLWPAVFEDLKAKKLITLAKSGEQEGAYVVEFGIEERQNKIMVKSNGNATYTAKDLAYQLWKFGLTPIDFAYYLRGIQNNGLPLLTTPSGTKLMDNSTPATRKFSPTTKVINVIDIRQSYPQEVIKSILERLGFKEAASNYVHLKYDVVRLSLAALKELGIKPEEDKESYAMSGREGIGVKIDDLFKKTGAKIKKTNPDLLPETLDSIVAGTIRYYILKNRPEKEVVFDFDEALRTDGNTGVYLQYAYARCHNILQKVPNWDYQASKLVAPTEISLESAKIIKLLEKYPEVLALAAEEFDPSLLTDYAFELANNFAKFYEKNPVLQANEETKNFRLQLVASVKQILNNTLSILGIIPLEKI